MKGPVASQTRVRGFVRCAKCKRLLMKREATWLDGSPYGAECKTQAASSLSSETDEEYIERKLRESGA